MWGLLEWAVVGLALVTLGAMLCSLPDRRDRRIDRQVRTQRGRVLDGAEELCRRAAEDRWT